jgi:hypothetical protein
MTTAARIRSFAAAPWRGWLALCFACGLLLAPAQAAQHAWAMALGADICSASDQDGASGAAASAHACCDAGLSALPPPAVPVASGRLPSVPPQAAPWPGDVPFAGCALPPSRGPPASASSLPKPH